MNNVDITKPPAELPRTNMTELMPGVSLLLPLSRRGYGPGLVVLNEDTDAPLSFVDGVPFPLVKWAEEGYTVVEIQERALRSGGGGGGGGGGGTVTAIRKAMEVLSGCNRCEPKGRVGVVAYARRLWDLAVPCLNDVSEMVAVVIYADATNGSSTSTTTTTFSSIPRLEHLAGRPAVGSSPKRTDALTEYYYANVKDGYFACPSRRDSFNYGAESVSHTRSLSFLKPRLGGPYFDLEMIWDEHTYYEFADRSVEHTMSTMVQEPYVNHIPTMTGGIGRDSLFEFYKHHFIFNNSEDTDLELISRTIGIDRVVDEFIFKFTHDRELDWLIPGIPPTNKHVEMPMTAVVNIRGDRLYHEHISWDQGTALQQLGLMPEYLPYPYRLPDGTGPAAGKRFEYRVPVAGTDTADKVRDRMLVSSNGMLRFGIREV